MKQVCRFAVALALLAPLATSGLAQELETTRGVVFEDRNGNGTRDDGEPGIAGIVVSTLQTTTVTDAEGRYTIGVPENSILFVRKPSGYRVPLNRLNLPQFHYSHFPNGSPPVKYGGMPATGPLPADLNFALIPHDEPEQFEVIVFGDPQPRSAEEVDWLTTDALDELVGTDAAFGIALGDIMFDQLSLFGRYNRAVARVGIPFYNIIGNHDIDFDVDNHVDSTHTFTRHYGPLNYSWQHGRVHFVALESIRWNGPARPPSTDSSYTEILRADVLDWLERDLATVPDDMLIVLCLHAPLFKAPSGNKIRNFDRLMQILRDRPKVLAMSGHTHYSSITTFGETHGWRGEGSFVELNAATLSGAWWKGPKDIRGIPITDQRDGTPNGYTILEIDGTDYKTRFKAASQDRDYQIRLYPPGTHSAGDDPHRTILANVFYGAPESVVEYRLNDGEWTPMEFAPQHDPRIAAHDWVRPTVSHHIWQATLPALLPSGTNIITVRVDNAGGYAFEASRIFVRGPQE